MKKQYLFTTLVLCGLFLSSCFTSGLDSVESDSSASATQNVNAGGNGETRSTTSPTISGLWSNPATWPGGLVPAAGANVVIPAGQTITLDTATAALGSLEINGTLQAIPNQDVAITSDWIRIMHGTLQIGSQAQPFMHRAVITLTGARGTHTARTADNGLDNDGVQRGIDVHHGALQLFGNPPSVTATKLNQHAAAGATTLVLSDPVSWKAGDTIAISVTDFYDENKRTEIRTLASDANGTSITLTQPINHPRWGRLQYPTNTAVNGNAMSLTPGTFTPASANTPTVLDERAEVANLTRNIVIQGADDSDWQTHGFGGHVMIMGRESTAQAYGVEFRRVGQLQAMGRYPWHWHVLSYSFSNGDYLGDADPTQHFIEKSAIWDKQTAPLPFMEPVVCASSSNIAVNIQGHAYFLEDGSEQRNVIDHNIAMDIRVPVNPIKRHDEQAAGFWLTNPDNEVFANSASGARVGLWNSFALQVFGSSHLAKDGQGNAITPYRLNIRRFEDNQGYGNHRLGILTEEIVVNETGEIGLNQFQGQGNLIGNKAWKNFQGYLNRFQSPFYKEWVFADNQYFDISGATISGELRDFLMVGTSLNSATPNPHTGVKIALASYHHSVSIVNVTALNYKDNPLPQLDGATFRGSGVFDSGDFYHFGVSLGHINDTGWRIINSNVGFVNPPPSFDGLPLDLWNWDHSAIWMQRHWSTAGGIWDPQGYWGPAGNFLTFNDPYFLLGTNPATRVPVQPASQVAISVPDRFFGLEDLNLDNATSFLTDPIRYERLDWTPLMVAPDISDPNSVVGFHDIPRQMANGFFPGFRYSAAKINGAYNIKLPEGRLPTQSVHLTVTNAYRSDDRVIVGLPWDGGLPVEGMIQSGGPGDYPNGSQYVRPLVFTNNLQEVFDDQSGSKAYKDALHNTVFVSYLGGLPMSPGAAWICNHPDPVLGALSGTTNDCLYRRNFIKLRQP